jgi:MFS family permease
MGLFATALAIGGVAGPLLSGMLVQHLGFQIAFYTFAGLAALGAAVFTWSVPETVLEAGQAATPNPEVAVVGIRRRPAI